MQKRRICTPTTTKKKNKERKNSMFRCKYLYFDCEKQHNLFSCCRFIGKFLLLVFLLFVGSEVKQTQTQIYFEPKKKNENICHEQRIWLFLYVHTMYREKKNAKFNIIFMLEWVLARGDDFIKMDNNHLLFGKWRPNAFFAWHRAE